MCCNNNDMVRNILSCHLPSSIKALMNKLFRFIYD